MGKYQESGSWIKLVLCTLLTIVGCALLFIGMFLPPSGEIHHSVLMATAEVFVFSGALAGVAVSYELKLQKFMNEIKALDNKKEA